MEKGAASPGRWQVWQCFCKIGDTSLVNVGGGLLGSCPSAYPAQHSVPASRMDKYFMNFPTSRFAPRHTKLRTEQANLPAGVGFTFSFIPLRTVVAHLCPNKAISARIRAHDATEVAQSKQQAGLYPLGHPSRTSLLRSWRKSFVRLCLYQALSGFHAVGR